MPAPLTVRREFHRSAKPPVFAVDFGDAVAFRQPEADDAAPVGADVVHAVSDGSAVAVVDKDVRRDGRVGAADVDVDRVGGVAVAPRNGADRPVAGEDGAACHAQGIVVRRPLVASAADAEVTLVDGEDRAAGDGDVAEHVAERTVLDAGADGVGAFAGRRGHEAAGNLDAAVLAAVVAAAADAGAVFAAGRGDGPTLDADGSGLGVFVAADAGRARAADSGEGWIVGLLDRWIVGGAGDRERRAAGDGDARAADAARRGVVADERERRGHAGGEMDRAAVRDGRGVEASTTALESVTAQPDSMATVPLVSHPESSNGPLPVSVTVRLVPS